MSGRETATLKIGGVPIGIEWDPQLGPLSSDRIYDSFLTANQPEVTLRIHRSPAPHIPEPRDQVFDSESHWKFFRTDGRSVVTLQSSRDGGMPYSVAIFDAAFRTGDVYMMGPAWSGVRSAYDAPGALDSTLAQILTICLLSKGRGMLIHACGVEYNGRGYLFAGHSGHGKSTMASLWAEKGLVLNDDRIALRLGPHGFVMYGTPWHGDYKSGLNRSVPLHKCFVLARGERDSAVALTKTAACSMLMARGFLMLWDEEGMEFTMDFVTGLVSEIPTYELSFLPNEEIVDFISCMN